MNASVDKNEQAKTAAINSLINNQKRIEKVFNQLIQGYALQKIDQEATDLQLFEGIRDAFIIDIEGLTHRLSRLQKIDSASLNFIIRKTENNEETLKNLANLIANNNFTDKAWGESINTFDSNIADMNAFIAKIDIEQQFQNYKRDANKLIKELQDNQNELVHKIEQVDIINNDLKNKKVHEIFADDSEKFKKLAKRYEVSFYIALAFLFLYFFGWYVEINTNFFKFKLAEQFYENHSTIFYIQKVSLLILSTTLAAFLLKRSFMNRRLADEAYRTAKELDALPRYMEGMPNEMKEKIRFDLAYKYFGNGIHHESYTGGENLMHENIKANTDFIKAVKDLKTSDSGKVNSEGK
ncbi:hypothetical protein [Acinetobacter sp. AHP123]|uniref:hypothetical protein n=1 Tax=Acinetobacter sp. AHP123 TaxID=2913495 RepID=UPI002074F9A3|nr:hypothetical protein [Acinetobacter sp. AHP123]